MISFRRREILPTEKVRLTDCNRSVRDFNFHLNSVHERSFTRTRWGEMTFHVGSYALCSCIIFRSKVIFLERRRESIENRFSESDIKRLSAGVYTESAGSSSGRSAALVRRAAIQPEWWPERALIHRLRTRNPREKGP